jgi:hypothetical protein
MTNPFDPNYLAAESAQFGVFAWIFFALQIVALLAGLYIIYLRADTNQVRKRIWKQLGIGLAVIGGVGVVLGLLRLANVPIFNLRFWFYLLLLVELGLGAYAFYFSRTSYPQLIAQSNKKSRAIAAAQQRTQVKAGATNTPEVASTPRGTSPRRQARRDHKRRNR